MLESLTIRNFALIRDLNFNPDKGLNVITGETGAGKSILLGALGLVLGNRAETTALLNKEQKCVIEGTFLNQNEDITALFASNDLDDPGHIILRREIAPGGKSRAFVNDTPVSLSLMREIGDRLIEIHTQNTGQLITSAAEQLALLDDYAGHKAEVLACSRKWKLYSQLKAELETVKEEIQAAGKEQDYLQYQYDELEQFAPRDNESEILEKQAMLLSHAEEISNACTGAGFMISESEGSLIDKLAAIRGLLKPVAPVNPDIAAMLQRLDQVNEELKDIASGLRETGSSTDHDPGRLDEINQRLAKLQMLLKKHQLTHSVELLDLMAALEIRLLNNSLATQRLDSLEAEVAEAWAAFLKESQQLHELRTSAAVRLCREAELLLHQLEMPAAALNVELKFAENSPGPGGCTQARLMFSANPGQPLQPLEKVASGGEVSRLNFCFKALLAGKKAMPTLIFDEADTGVSGEVAGKMGAMMRTLGVNHQVIAITHLPQVAAAGSSHFFVYKEINEQGAMTQMKRIINQERVTNIARMLSGKDPGEAALANARELLNVS